jgi:hypothetical protein
MGNELDSAGFPWADDCSICAMKCVLASVCCNIRSGNFERSRRECGNTNDGIRQGDGLGHDQEYVAASPAARSGDEQPRPEPGSGGPLGNDTRRVYRIR